VVAGAVALLTGCAAADGGSSTSPQPAVLTAKQAVQLAAQTARGANSFTGTTAIAISAAGGHATITASFAERLHPSLLARVDVSTFKIPGVPAGTNLNGLTEIVTPSAVYLKWPFITSLMHTSKPWVKVSLSALGASGAVNLTSLFTQFSNNGPLTQDSMLAGATSVRTVGTGTLNGVPVTEYTGTVSVTKALAALDPSSRSAVSKAITQAGIGSMRFTIWVDGQHIVRKSVVTESGSMMSEVITTTLTSVNQPVSVQVPADSDVATPSGGLFG
jgi:hypothetical protein